MTVLCKLEKHDVSVIKLITLQKDQKIIFLLCPFNIFSLIASNENENGNFTEPREIVARISEARNLKAVIDESISTIGADDSPEKWFYCRRGLISQRRWSIDSIQERPVVVWSRLAGWSSSLFQP